MPNEKEVRSGEKPADDGFTCSVTGKCCRCGDSGRCESRLDRKDLDESTAQTLRLIKTSRIYLTATKDTLDDIQPEWEQKRRWPSPELREVRRKVVTAIAMLDEIGGDL